MKIKELSRPSDATRILNALKGKDVYDGYPEKLAKCKAEDLRKINGLRIKSIGIIASALEGLGLIEDAEEWLMR